MDEKSLLCERFLHLWPQHALPHTLWNVPGWSPRACYIGRGCQCFVCPGSRIEEWMSRMDAILLGRTSNHGLMLRRMRGWMMGEDIVSREAPALCIISWPPHLVLASTMSALPCLVSCIGMHANRLKNPIAKANNKVCVFVGPPIHEGSFSALGAISRQTFHRLKY